jgi:hypothetical protein
MLPPGLKRPGSAGRGLSDAAPRAPAARWVLGRPLAALAAQSRPPRSRRVARAGVDCRPLAAERAHCARALSRRMSLARTCAPARRRWDTYARDLDGCAEQLPQHLEAVFLILNLVYNILTRNCQCTSVNSRTRVTSKRPTVYYVVLVDSTNDIIRLNFCTAAIRPDLRATGVHVCSCIV